MRTSLLAAATIACALLTPVAFAQDKSAPAKPAMTMDMDKQMSQMQANMKTMQQQMDKLRATTDPTKRQKLMQEHMQTMQDSMKSMHGMGGPMMMGGTMGSGMAMGGQKDTAGGDMMQRQNMMEHRLDMLQMMMEQMMHHHQMMQSMPAK